MNRKSREDFFMLNRENINEFILNYQDTAVLLDFILQEYFDELEEMLSKLKLFYINSRKKFSEKIVISIVQRVFDLSKIKFTHENVIKSLKLNNKALNLATELYCKHIQCYKLVKLILNEIYLNGNVDPNLLINTIEIINLEIIDKYEVNVLINDKEYMDKLCKCLDGLLENNYIDNLHDYYLIFGLLLFNRNIRLKSIFNSLIFDYSIETLYLRPVVVIEQGISLFNDFMIEPTPNDLTKFLFIVDNLSVFKSIKDCDKKIFYEMSDLIGHDLLIHKFISIETNKDYLKLIEGKYKPYADERYNQLNQSPKY
ncbi:hypothetical protein A0H76_957 [Hepatospora eriocheir]|uniref:Uncharacterized protein n=1 Tax=Hepatospora eriocheir TaxID=1081669 RepID=A0A1X0QHW5_9MICR|nr:hypothetical protein A0H76_957 [Hepatospora eriocheir]